jgi:methionine-rich copper-binding protein CopC
MTHPARRLRACLLVLGVIASLALPLSASAHSELVSSSPADGDAVTASPSEIVLTFSAALDPKKSSIVLKDASGSKLATTGVDPAKNTVMRMTPPALAPGEYEIDWTSVATDGDLLRGKVTFTVLQPAATPSPAPTESAVPSTVAHPTPTSLPSPAPSAAPAPASASGTDVILPVIVAIVLIAALGALLLRRRNDGGTL